MLMDTFQRIKRTPKKTIMLRALRGSINPPLIRLTALPPHKQDKPIVIVGGPRSGTTWLAEIITTIPKSGLIFEPLYLPKVRQARNVGVQWYTFLAPNEKWLQGERFLQDIFTGKVLNFWTTSFMPLHRSIRPQVWVIKMVRANMMFGWMLEQFPFLKPALLIRHPCATVLSMRQQGWPLPDRPPHIKKFEAFYPYAKDIINGLQDPVEFSTALWCMSYLTALHLADRKKYIIVCYERLVRDGVNEIQRLFDFFHKNLPDEAVDNLRRYSQMTKKDSPIRKSGDSLAKWRHCLSNKEIAMILNVVDRFGLDFYSRQLEPDYDRLYSDSPVSVDLRN